MTNGSNGGAARAAPPFGIPWSIWSIVLTQIVTFAGFIYAIDQRSRDSEKTIAQYVEIIKTLNTQTDALRSQVERNTSRAEFQQRELSYILWTLFPNGVLPAGKLGGTVPEFPRKDFEAEPPKQ